MRVIRVEKKNRKTGKTEVLKGEELQKFLKDHGYIQKEGRNDNTKL